jgi:copper(I)-binding protein
MIPTFRNWRRAAVPAAMALALVAVPACSSDDNTTSTGSNDTTANTQAMQAEVKVGDPWARSSPANAKNGAIYLTLTANEDDKLLKASVDESIAKMTQVHETVMADSSMSDDTMAKEPMSSDTMAKEQMTGDTAMSGAMTMKEVESIELPKGETVELKPGGYHIMLMELVKPLEVGQKIKVTLTFENAEAITVEAEVREG